MLASSLAGILMMWTPPPRVGGNSADRPQMRDEELL